MGGKESAEHHFQVYPPHSTACPSRGLHGLLSAHPMPMKELGLGCEDRSLETGMDTDHPPSVGPCLITWFF